MSIERILVVGSGTMGRGIAQAAAAGGFSVVLNDMDSSILDAALAAIRKALEKGVSLGKLARGQADEILGRISAETDLPRAATAADFLIEAVPEKMALKTALFSRIHGMVSEHVIFASNTSSLSITEMAEGSGRPDRFIGMHFFNPVHLMKLLEVVRGDKTTEATLERALAVGKRMGKETIVVNDVPGFASSRLGVALGLEAMRMLESGVASAADIDRAMELGYHHPMGPLRLTDLVGLDVRLSIAEYLFSKLNSEAFRPPEILRQKIREGKLGKKTGEGFYQWKD